MLSALESKLERGQTIRQALSFPTWYWRRRNYRAAGRAARLSRSTLIRLLYHWRAHGRNRSCLALHYAAARVTIPAAVQRDYLVACLAPNVLTLPAAYHRLPAATRRQFSYFVVNRSLAPRVRQAIRKLNQTRRIYLRAVWSFRNLLKLQ